MLNRFLYFSALSLCAVSPFVLWSGEAQAQECKPPYEMVTALFHPDPGSSGVWDAFYGEAGSEEEFTSLVPLEGGGVFAAGEYRKAEGEKPALVLAEFDRRGKKLWDRTYALKGLEKIVKVLPQDGGFMVLANKAETFWIGFFTATGDMKAQKEFSEKQMSLSASDIVLSADGKNFAVSVTAESQDTKTKNPVLPKEAAFYILDTKGVLINKRHYDVGEESEILGLSVAKFADKKTGYIATGYFKNSFGKKTGWVLRLEEDGALVWQREFDRGLASQIRISSVYNEKSVLAFGDVLPANSGSIGSWLMMLDSGNGEILWQRYYSAGESAHDYFAGGLLVNADGLILPAMRAIARGTKNGQGEPSAKTIEGADDDKPMVGDHVLPQSVDYAHFLTLSPRGITLSGDSYFAGQGAQIGQVIIGKKGERVIAGSAVIANGDAYGAMKAEEIKAEVLKEESIPSAKLPEAKLSDKTQKGLELLKQKIGVKTDKENQPNTGESNSAKIGDLAKPVKSSSKNGWILVGASPDTYKDPCKQSIQSLPD